MKDYQSILNTIPKEDEALAIFKKLKLQPLDINSPTLAHLFLAEIDELKSEHVYFWNLGKLSSGISFIYNESIFDLYSSAYRDVCKVLEEDIDLEFLKNIIILERSIYKNEYSLDKVIANSGSQPAISYMQMQLSKYTTATG